MVAGWLWGTLSMLWALLDGVQGGEKCGNPFQGPRGFNPPRLSQCSLRCATLTYYKLLAGEQRGSVLFTEATARSEQHFCWFLSQRCQDEEVLEMAFVMVDTDLPLCQLIIDHSGSGQQWLNPDREAHPLLSPLCGLRFEVTLPFQKAQNAAEFCVRPLCPTSNQESSNTETSGRCPPFLVTLWN